jgi:hypothetical protein
MSFLSSPIAAPTTVFYSNTAVTTVAAGAGEFVVQAIPLGVGFFTDKTMRASIGVQNLDPFDITTFRFRLGASAVNPALNSLIASGVVDGSITFSIGFMLSLRRYDASNLQRAATLNQNISYLPFAFANDGLIALANIDTASLYLMITAQGAGSPCSVHTAIVERL